MIKIDFSTLGKPVEGRKRNPRNQRIKSACKSERLNRFYRTLINAREPGRGKETVVVLPGTFSKIFWKIDQIQCENAMFYMAKYGQFSIILSEIYHGTRFNQLGRKLPSQIITTTLNTTLSVLAIIPSSKFRITLRTIYLSGFLRRVARDHQFDLKPELIYYKVPYI